MILSAIDLLLRVSEASVGGTEVPANTNCGPYVEPVLASVGLPKGNPWCAAQVYQWGHIALREKWPLPQTGGCVILGEFATKKKILFETPEVGDVFLLWERVAGVWRFAHTGLVTALGTPTPTREGNTSGGGSREGWIVANHTRTFKPADRFVRWVNLLKQGDR